MCQLKIASIILICFKCRITGLLYSKMENIYKSCRLKQMDLIGVQKIEETVSMRGTKGWYIIYQSGLKVIGTHQCSWWKNVELISSDIFYATIDQELANISD